MAVDCESFAVDLSAYFDGELDAREAAAVSEHLSGCGACRSKLEKMRLLREALHRSGSAALPEDRLIEDLMRALRRPDAPGGGAMPGAPPRATRGR